MNFTLTQEQTSVFEKLEQFLQSNSKQVCILTGPAGSGKSTIIHSLATHLEQAMRPFWLLAPTGSATYNLNRRTGFPTQTIHSKLYEYSHISEKKDNEFTLVYGLKTSESRPDVIIIDEASMVSDQEQASDMLQFGSGRLLSDLVQLMGSFKTLPKLIFIGDPYQLAPVQSHLSPCLSSLYLQKEFGFSCVELELTQVMRQTDAFLLSTLQGLRNQILKKDESSIKWVGKDPDSKKMSEIPEICLKLNPVIEPYKNVVLAYTNKQVSDYNREIRKAYGFTNTLEEGDLLISIKNRMLENEIVIPNGTLLKVKQVAKENITRRIHLKTKSGDTLIQLEFKTIEVVPLLSNDESSVRLLCLENTLQMETSNLDKEHIQALFVDFLMRNTDLLEAKKKAKVNPDTYKTWLQLFSSKLRKDPYFNALMAKYAYASTAHRAQGHEWETVFIDTNHKHGIQNQDGLRWLYTACSRAKNQFSLIHAEKTIGVLADCQFKGLSQLKSIPAGFYAQNEVKPQANDHPHIHQFPFLKPHITLLKQIEYELDAVLELTFISYLLRTKWFKNEKMVQIDFTYSKKGLKEIGVIQNLYEQSTFYRMVLNLIKTHVSTVFLPKPRNDNEFAFQKKLKEVADFFEIKLCNVVLSPPYETTYYLESNEGKAILKIWNDDKGRYTSALMDAEMGLQSKTYIDFVQELFGFEC